MKKLNQELIELAKARVELAETKAELAELESQLPALVPRLFELKDKVKQAAERADLADQEVRTLALLEEGELPKQVQVVNSSEVYIPSPNKVREWCLKNFLPALIVDNKVFNNAVKGGAGIPQEIAEIRTFKKVKIATNLNELLDDKQTLRSQ